MKNNEKTVKRAEIHTSYVDIHQPVVVLRGRGFPVAAADASVVEGSVQMFITLAIMLEVY